MYKKLKKVIDPQLVIEQSQIALALSNKVKLSLYKKSVNSGISANILEEVYRRGHSIWNDKFKGTREQFAFDRVNSFIAGGFAADLDKDLMESDVPTPSEKKLSQKYKVSLKQIKKLVKTGSKIEKEHTTSQKDAEEIARDHLGEKPNYYKLLKRYVEEVETHTRSKGNYIVPEFLRKEKKLVEETELHSKNKNNPASRFDGSNELVDVYRNDTPGQSKKSTLSTIRRICKNEK